MRRYETIFVSQADLPEEEINVFIERYSNIIKTRKGTVIKVEKWGKKKLAYEIKKQQRGYYVLIDFAGTSAMVAELERNFKIDDKILKYMTIKTADDISAADIEKEMAPPAVAQEKEAAIPAPLEAAPKKENAEPEKEEIKVSSPESDKKEEE